MRNLRQQLGETQDLLDLTTLTRLQLCALQSRIAEELERRDEADAEVNVEDEEEAEKEDEPQIEELLSYVRGAASREAGSDKRKREPGESEASTAAKSCQVVTLDSVADRLNFAKQHGFSFEPGDCDSIEEELDCCGVPERYAEHPPPNWKAYRRQQPGIAFFPSDADAVYVISEGAFGSVLELS